MNRRENLTAYEVLPEDLAIYMSHHGPHFNKKCCEFAVGLMTDEDDKPIQAFNKEEIDILLKNYNISLKYNQLYDYVYVANMCKADYYKKSVPKEEHLALFIKDAIDDPDGCEGIVFNRWIADMKWLGIAIPWDELI